MIIAFDVDGTLLDYEDNPRGDLVELANKLIQAGWQVIVWSGGGQSYAETRARQLGIVGAICLAKDPHIQVDIAIDDMPDTSFAANTTLVVRSR